MDYPRPIHPLAPPENGTKVSLSHLVMNLSGLKVCGSSQYRAAQLSVSHLDRLPDRLNLTVIMKSNDVDGDPAPSRDRKHSRLTRLVSNSESGVFSAVLRNTNNLIIDHQRLLIPAPEYT